MLVVGVAAGIGQSWHTRRLVEAVLAGAAASQGGVETQLLDLSQTPVDFAANKALSDYSQDTQAAVDLISRADAFVFGSPIYRASYTGVLKNLFDLLPPEPLIGKVAGLVATGGSFHHFLSPDILFRPLMTFFNMHTVPGVLYGSREQFLEGGELSEPLRQQAETLGQDVAYMARQLAGQGIGPLSPGVAAVRRP